MDRRRHGIVAAALAACAWIVLAPYACSSASPSAAAADAGTAPDGAAPPDSPVPPGADAVAPDSPAPCVPPDAGPDAFPSNGPLATGAPIPDPAFAVYAPADGALPPRALRDHFRPCGPPGLLVLRAT